MHVRFVMERNKSRSIEKFQDRRRKWQPQATCEELFFAVRQVFSSYSMEMEGAAEKGNPLQNACNSVQLRPIPLINPCNLGLSCCFLFLPCFTCKLSFASCLPLSLADFTLRK